MKHLFTLLAFFIFIGLQAQVFPVQSTSQLVPPYSVYLSDYATPGTEKLRVILVQRDLTQPSYQLRLVMSVELNGKLILRTSRTYSPAPLNLNPGIPTVISGADLAPYLDSRNIDFIGYSREQYERTRALPEGSYQISFTAYDYHRQDVQVSNAGSSFYYLSKNEPPIINFPACGTQVLMRTPQQIVFSWLARNTASPNSAAETQYEFALYETRPAGRNPNDVVLSTQPVYRTIVDNTQLIYGPAEPLLLENMKYVWRVKAIDREGRDAFRNNGYSEVCTFNYSNIGTAFDIGVVKGLQAVGETERRGKLTWTKGEYDAYRVNYRKTGNGSYEWFTTDITTEQLAKEGKTDGELKLFDLEPDTEYETRVQGKKSGILGAYTEIKTFKTMPMHVAACGEALPLPKPPGNPYRTAIKGEIINADGMEVILSEVNNLGEGFYAGTGRVSFPYLGGASFAVQFKRIYINSDRNVEQGRIDFVTKGVAAMVEQQVSNTKLNAQNKIQQENREAWVDTEFYGKVFVYDQIEIDKVTPNGESMVDIADEDGTVRANAEVMQVINASPNKAIIIQDKSGDQFVVQKVKAKDSDGNDIDQIKVTKVEGGGLMPGDDGKMMSEAQIRDLRKLIIATLKEFKVAIEDYIASNTIDTNQGGKKSIKEFDLSMFAAKLPVCLEDHKNEIPIIYEKVKVVSDEATSESQKFVTKVVVKLTATSTKTDIESETCETLVEDLIIDIPGERTYVTPAGTLLKLPANHKVNSACIDQSLYPNGSLLNFTVDGKTYQAKIIASGTPYFNGYYEVVGQAYGSAYDDTNQYISKKTEASFVQRITGEDGKSTSGKIYIGEYIASDVRTNQQIVSVGGIPVNFFSLPEAKSNTTSINLTFGECPETSLDNYIKDAKLQKWLTSKGLKADVYLSDCKTGKTTHITDNTTNTADNTSAKQQYENGSFTNDIAVWACWDGKQWKVEHKYKPGTLHPTHDKIKADLTEISKEIDKRIDKLVSDANAGNGRKSDVTYDYGEDGQVHLEGMDFLQAIIAIKDFSKTLVNYAKIPEQTWDNKNKADEYSKYPVHVPPMLAGAGDQTLEEMTGALQFVSFGLDMATNPEMAKQSWEKIKNVKFSDVKKLVIGGAQEKYNKYAQGGVIARHEAGRDGVQVAMVVFGAVKKLGSNAKDIVENADEITDVAKKFDLDDVVRKDLGDAIESADAGQLIKECTENIELKEFVEQSAKELKDVAENQGKKLSWKDILARFKRGNDFNRKGRIKYGDRQSEIVLQGIDGKPGKRLDVYIPPTDGNLGKIISRKATDLDKISEQTWRNYCNELVTKYKVGTPLQSTKLPGEPPLSGKYYLEIPSSNQLAQKLETFKTIAKEYGKDNGGIEIIFLNE